MRTGGRPRVVIVGAGFGGLFAAKGLADADADVILIDRHNYHLFQPLLYQVATAGLAPSDIAWPIRSILTKARNTTVLLATVTGIDAANQRLMLEDGAVDYDFLVLATGAQHAYFGNDAWREFAPGLKSVDDATSMRRRLLLAFERAESCDDPAERERLLRFVIVGAGPTGVELAGAVAELAQHTLARDFRRIDPRSAKVVLVEAGPRVLPTFSERSSEYAARSLRRLGVDVRTRTPVTACDARGVTLGEGHRAENLAAASVIWAAGVAASPVGAWLDLATDRQGRVPVQNDLSIDGADGVFVIGDAAQITMADGRPVPGTAPAAKQQGRYVARVIAARIDAGGSQVPGRRAVGPRAARRRSAKAPGPFRYRDVGNLATIGRRSAVVEFGRLRLRGRLAWWLWGIAHIYFLIGLPSPLIVSIRWLWEYLTYGKGARLITGAAPESSRR